MQFWELNADLAPIKPLYFEPGSKRMARLLSPNAHTSSNFNTIHLKISTHT